MFSPSPSDFMTEGKTGICAAHGVVEILGIGALERDIRYNWENLGREPKESPEEVEPQACPIR